MNSIVMTVATIPAVLALVTLAKDLGMPKKLSPILAIFLGIGLVVLDNLTNHVAVDIPQVIATGLILGLSASGLYDSTKMINNHNSENLS